MTVQGPVGSSHATPREPLTAASPPLLALVAAAAVGIGVLSSGYVAILPAFRFTAQVPAILPVLLWPAACGIGSVAAGARQAFAPWRASFGPVSLLPWAVLLALPSVAPDLAIPMWAPVVAGAAAAAPFVVLAARGTLPWSVAGRRRVDDASLRGTFLVAVAIMVMVWSVGGPPIAGTIAGVLLAVALVVAGLLPGGLAQAARAWGMRHWLALAWASVVVWLAVPVSATTAFFRDPWYLVSSMVLAALPLILVNRTDAVGARH